MNITELLSEYLKQGKTVDIPGIGSFCAQQVSAYYDADASTFFPTQQRISFSPRMLGGSSFANYIAEKDCVSVAIGERTWANYVEAMKAQLDTDGQLVLHGLGTITRGNLGLEFVAEEGLNDENPYMKAVKGVKQYASQSNANPFARFDSIPQPEPEPVVVPIAPIAESAPVVEEPVSAVEPEAPVVEESALAEEPSIPVIDPTTEMAEETALTAPETEPSHASEPSAAAPVATEPVAQPIEPVVEATAEPEVIESPVEEPVAHDADQTTLEGLKELERMQSESVENNNRNQGTQDDESEKKPRKKKTWLWILLAILLLLLGAGGFLWKTGKLDTLLGNNPSASNQDIDIEKMISGSEGSEAETPKANVDDAEAGEVYGDEPASDTESNAVSIDNESDATTPTAEEPAPTETAQPAASEKQTLPANTNLFTYSTDGLNYEQNELDAYTSEVMARMDSYITNYATLRRYSKAVDMLKAKSAEYTRSIMEERLGHPNEIAFHQLLPYNDYVRNYNMPAIKGRKATRTKVLIQSELMESKLEELLNQVISENGIEQDAAPAVAPRPAQPVSTASYSSHSKKGYDIIAGFFVTKAYADRMATNLKKKGCDAYIIEVNQGYYVSMGSAESRTKAESLYAHIKEWYKGDISIKKF